MTRLLPEIGPRGRAVKRLLVVGNGPTGIDEDGTQHLEQPSAELLFGLADLGYEVTFLQPVVPLDKTLGYYGSTLTHDGLRAVGLDMRTFMGTITTSWAALRVLLRAEFVHIFYPGRLPDLVIRLCRWLGKPYSLFIRGDRFDEQSADARNLRGAKFILAVSPVLADRVLPLNRNAIAIRSLCHVTASDSYERPLESRQDRALRLLFVGRLEPVKGVVELLDAFALLRARGIAAELTLVGGGELHEAVSQALARNPDPTIRMLGTVEDSRRLLQIYEEHDVLVLPTHSEGFPRVLYEAMVKSTVIVTTMVGGIPAVMQDGVNCLAIPVGDPAALAQAIERLAGDPELMTRLAQAGLATVLSVFKNNPLHHLALARALGAADGAGPQAARNSGSSGPLAQAAPASPKAARKQAR